MSSLSRPSVAQSSIRRVAILFAGGPAPAANAVISTAAVSFLRNDIQVLGILNGYSQLVKYAPDSPLQKGRDYVEIDHRMLKRTRNSRGIMIGTARTNPGRLVNSPEDLCDPNRTEPKLRTAHAAASVSSMWMPSTSRSAVTTPSRPANKFLRFQEFLPEGHRRGSRSSTSPRRSTTTIWELTSRSDTSRRWRRSPARSSTSWPTPRLDGPTISLRRWAGAAGWLAYGAAIAGEASLVISVEDIVGHYRDEETVPDAKPGEPDTRPVMNMDAVVRRIVRTMTTRDQEGKEFGVIVLAEGLAEYLPIEYLHGVTRDEHGHISISQVNLAQTVADLVSTEYDRQTGKSRRVRGLQLGYEARCAIPLAFDVMLGSQLGVGAYRALAEENHDGVMVSVSGQLNLTYVPFAQLVDPQTLVTVVRFISTDSDFHRLARFLETYVHD